MKVKITEFGDSHCQPCISQKSIMKKLREKHKDWTIKEVDIMKNKKMSDKNDIKSVPTFIVEKGPKKKRWSGGPVGVSEMERIIRKM